MSLKISSKIGNISQDSYGYASTIGDVNGDGINEIIVASTNGKNGATIYIYNADTLKLQKSLSIGKKKVNTIRLITTDINKDNCDELIVGITYQDLSGEVRVFSVKNNKLIHRWQSVNKFDTFGFSLAVGDVNGDGIDDIVVGAPQPVEDGKGKVYVYNGENGELIKEYSSRVPRGTSDFATSLAVGDVNGDGINEVIIGAPGIENGEVFIYSVEHGWLVQHLTGDPGFGIVVKADDINGDDATELIVTTKNLEGNTVSVYQNRLFYPLYEITNDEVDIGFGEAITIGDINGDGLNELIIGAFDSNHGRKKYTGLVSVYSGEDGELLNRWYGKEEKEQFGFSLSSGTIGNENKPTLIIGAPREMLKKKGKIYLVNFE